MTTHTHTRTNQSVLRRSARALGRFWLQLAESAAPRRPLNADRWSDYPRFPWF